ncbi:MAG TPA: Glu-tRNA(Gln) amidotransferase subunit GatE, partial [Candidatus Thermoplasmatota archaeon]|nr:Glu-tRNA(Gln) amidotransferase subunit GatE [Candidatus Thermoplasmatota archaeon]
GQGVSLSGAEAARLSQAPTLDYAAIGFRCGLEIHQQLDTRKLFSPCPSDVVAPEEIVRRTVGRVDRRLRVTQSELGETDPAALAEARRGRSFRYLVIEGLTSLVETDEEPPHPMCDEALDVALQLAGLVGAKPAAEVHVMRKTVIDGSNTSGFQRTALVATGGKVDAEGGDVGLWTMALEEDSARKLEERHDGLVTYTLDRLGIPLLEISTAPDIKDPAHAQRVAARIGALLRATGRVKRGLGTIRQDLNVSAGVGERVEIKGCQDLRAIPRIIETECRRQLWLYYVAQELKARGFHLAAQAHFHDVTSLVESADSKIIRNSLSQGARVLAIRLTTWNGLLRGATPNGPRMGRELADHARVAAGVNGIFHSDELPGYGISEQQVAAIRVKLSCTAVDAFVLCVDKRDKAELALKAVMERAKEAIFGSPKEVRGVQPDDSTRFLRPMPGAARMYPETDVPPTRITSERWQKILRNLPPKPEERIAAFVKQHGLPKEVAQQLLHEGLEVEFERLAAGGADAGLAARALLQFVPALKDPERGLAALPDLFAAAKAGRFAKEALPELLKALDADAALTPEAVVARLGAGAVDAAAVDTVCRRVVGERLAFVREKGADAAGPLMGPVMAELRGKADGKLIAARLQAAIQEALR